MPTQSEAVSPPGPFASLRLWSHKTGLKVKHGMYRDGGEWTAQVYEAKNGERPDIQAVDIGSLMQELDLDAVDILKIDIERSEAVVFSSNYKDWLSRVRNIVIELHDKECEEIFFRALSGFQYRVKTMGELVICRDIKLLEDKS